MNADAVVAAFVVGYCLGLLTLYALASTAARRDQARAAAYDRHIAQATGLAGGRR